MHESHERETNVAQETQTTNAPAETAEQLRVRLRMEVRTFQAKWNKRIGPYNKRHICTPEEVEIMESGNRKMVFDTPETVPGSSESAPANQQDPGKEAQRSLPQTQFQRNKKHLPEAVKLPNRRREIALWGVMVCGLLTSVPNMYSMTLAIKSGDFMLACGVTAAFTIAPGLMLLSGIRDWYARGCVSLVIGYEVFCNAASFYGGLTGLNRSNFIQPTNFLHMATGFAFDSQYEATARIISVFMAAGIASLVAVPAIKLADYYA